MSKLFKKLILVAFFITIFGSLLEAHNIDIKIGVLAKRGTDKTIQRWKPVSDYLSTRMKGYHILLVPLSFDQIDDAVENKKVDFILTNSSVYVVLEMKYGVSQIATLYNRVNDDIILDKFGGVIFTRADRVDINSLNDIVGRDFAAVDKTSFGGWQMAWLEFKHAGIDPQKDFASLNFIKTHDGVVKAVLEGRADAGTVRTDTLEKMVNEGKLNLQDIKVINSKQYPNFPLLVSTQLYPEWPMAVVPGASKEVAKELTRELFDMNKECECALQSGIGGWSVPGDYKLVLDTLKELNVSPFEKRSFSIKDVIKKYRMYIIVITIFVLLLIIRYIYVSRIKTMTEKLNASLETKVQQRTQELNHLNQTLEQRVQDEVDKNRQKDKEILVQSRHAAMGEVIQMLAHQWRQPITGIGMEVNNLLVDLELGESDTEKSIATLESVSKEIEKLSHIINDFSSRFKDDTKQENVHSENVMNEVLKVLQTTLEEHKISVTTTYRNKSEIYLCSRQLFQVYLNILNNAVEILIERSIENGNITISIEEDNEFVITKICDNGGGIDKEDIERIFEPYFSTKKEKNEKGLGLYISKTIVEQHLKGKISITTQDEETCFVLQIKKLTDLESGE
ncbi:sensor histidine kinase [Sulfurimonas sp.]|uniref:sensor histidine kinase n=1 Tax=Sulfurimonas sp. TaxID=2022749 RepID=UPI003D14985B